MQGNLLVREARLRAGLTQTELATRASTTQSAIARLERGHGHPSMDRIAELVAACGLELRVRLVPADDASWVQVRDNAALPPEQRVTKALAAIHLAQQLQAAGARDRAGTAG